MGKKEFLTYDQQIELLESRGLHTDDDTKTALMSESYYSIVNGYKDIFLDKAATHMASDDRYMAGSSFAHLHMIFEFDRMLRAVTFMQLVKSESVLTNAVVYAFCERHREDNAYLNLSNYCNRDSYYNPKHYNADAGKLLNVLFTALYNARDHDCVKHYLSKHGHVPLWVLANVLSFGNFSHFYMLQKRSIQNEACKIVSKGQNVPRITPEKLREVFSTLVDFRNICAHGDRLYCAKTGKRHDRKFSNMLSALAVITSKKDFNSFSKKLADVLGVFRPAEMLHARVLEKMNIKIKDGRVVVADSCE